MCVCVLISQIQCQVCTVLRFERPRVCRCCFDLIDIRQPKARLSGGYTPTDIILPHTTGEISAAEELLKLNPSRKHSGDSARSSLQASQRLSDSLDRPLAVARRRAISAPNQPSPLLQQSPLMQTSPLMQPLPFEPPTMGFSSSWAAPLPSAPLPSAPLRHSFVPQLAKIPSYSLLPPPLIHANQLGLLPPPLNSISGERVGSATMPKSQLQ